MDINTVMMFTVRRQTCSIITVGVGPTLPGVGLIWPKSWWGTLSPAVRDSSLSLNTFLRRLKLMKIIFSDADLHGRGAVATFLPFWRRLHTFLLTVIHRRRKLRTLLTFAVAQSHVTHASLIALRRKATWLWHVSKTKKRSSVS